MSNDRLIGVDIDDETLGASGPDAEHERRVAIFDLLESNSFKVIGQDEGPYQLNLSKAERRLDLTAALTACALVSTLASRRCPRRPPSSV